MKYNIAIIGNGYVGHPTGAVFAKKGHNVRLVDLDREKIAQTNRGEAVVHEPGLEELVQYGVSQGRLKAYHVDESEEAISDADIVFIATPTPYHGGKCDTRSVFAAANAAKEYMHDDQICIVKSTVSPGTTRAVTKAIRSHTKAKTAMIPETMAEGSAVRDLMYPDRIIVGSEYPEVMDTMHKLYDDRVVDDSSKLVYVGSSVNAELAKWGSNMMLANRLAALFSLADVCELIEGADIREVAKAIGLDSRLGKKFLHPNIRFGGSCFGKDVAALAAYGKAHDLSMPHISSILEQNDGGVPRFLDRMEEHMGTYDGKIIAVLGLGFKPRTDDMRDSPSVDMVRHFLDQGAYVRAHDYQAVPVAKLPEYIGEREGLCYYEEDDLSLLIRGADVSLMLTEEEGYQALKIKDVYDQMRGRLFCDAKTRWDPKEVNAAGLDYLGRGRPFSPGDKK